MTYSHRFTVHLLADLPHDPGTSICPCGEVGRPGPARAMGEVYEGGDDCPDSMRRHIADLTQLQQSIAKAGAAGVEYGRAEERKDIVTSLRAWVSDPTRPPNTAQFVRDIADAIEAGG